MSGEPLESVSRGIAAVLDEIFDGADPESGWLLNPGDVGLLDSLDRLSAEEASARSPGGGASVAGHVEHLRYSLELLNRWSCGEEPFGDADWATAWRRGEVSQADWERLRNDLRDEARRWKEGFKRRVRASERDMADVLASAAHLAYHLGAIRQIQPAARASSAAVSRPPGKEASR